MMSAIPPQSSRRTELCEAPLDLAAEGGLLSLLEGLLFDRIFEARAGVVVGTPESVEDLRRPIARWFSSYQLA